MQRRDGNSKAACAVHIPYFAIRRTPFFARVSGSACQEYGGVMHWNTQSIIVFCTPGNGDDAVYTTPPLEFPFCIHIPGCLPALATTRDSTNTIANNTTPITQ